MQIKIKNIIFNSPIIAASGTFGYGDEATNFVDVEKIGCIITKSITLEERKGNPHPRIHQSSTGMINAIGLSNVGVSRFCAEKLEKFNEINTNFMISIAGSTTEDYLKVLDTIESQNGTHVGYEINISCPNVKKGGIEFGLEEDTVLSLTSELRQLTDKLMFVKLSPNVTSIEKIALSAERGGADGISAVNTFLGLAIDYKTGEYFLSTKFGGVSGPPIKPLALAKINKIFENVKVPILGMGGISNYKDIIEFLRVGATMVQVGTLNYKDPSLLSKYYDDLNMFLKKNKIKSIESLIGKCKIPVIG
jgi:dihydroorotate dehydrogenase (NAD+) catalytic subunit